MGATAAIGTGLSVISGLGAASEKNAQAKAQKKAIENQAQIDQLNSQLQLLSLQSQQQVNQVQQQLQSAAESQAFLSRQAQLNVAESQNQLALQQAASQADTQGKLATVQQGDALTKALSQSVEQQGNIANTLTQAIQASSGEQQNVLKQLQAMPERQRASAISSLLDAAASGGGTNQALRALTEVLDGGEVGQVAQATERGANAQLLARNSADAASSEVNANRFALEGQANLQLNDATYQSRTAALDVQTAGQVAGASFASQRTATEGAYNAGLLSRSVSNSAADASFAANKEVLQRGAKLSADTAALQSQAVRGSSFFDYLNVGAGAYSTFTNLGGSFLSTSKPKTQTFSGFVDSNNA